MRRLPSVVALALLVVGCNEALGRNGRLWHMLGDTYSLTFPFAPLVERIEEQVNPGASTGNAAEPTRLAIVTGTSDEYNLAIMGYLSDFEYSSPLRLNGMTARYQSGQLLTAPGFGVGAADNVAEFAPHIVLDFTGGSFVERDVDAAFRARSLPPPFYVLPPVSARSQLLLEQIENDSSLRTRVVGLYFASAEDPTLYRAYLQRLHSIVPTDIPVPAFYEGLDFYPIVYDAMYSLIYSAAAGGRGGTAKAIGFERLILGPRREVGPAGIQSVLLRLSSSSDATLDLSGASGVFDFHVPTGGRIAFANAWCIDQNLEYVMDALRYDHFLDDFTGTLSCFDP